MLFVDSSSFAIARPICSPNKFLRVLKYHKLEHYQIEPGDLARIKDTKSPYYDKLLEVYSATSRYIYLWRPGVDKSKFRRGQFWTNSVIVGFDVFDIELEFRF